MPNFPYKLHELLERVEEDEELRSIISWLPDGKTFKIHSQEGFEKRLLREYFPRQTQIKSFMRQLQYYDFENFGEGIFRHRCFLRGQRNLCGQIMHQLPTKNQKKSGKSTRPLKTRGRKKKSKTLTINDKNPPSNNGGGGLATSSAPTSDATSTTTSSHSALAAVLARPSSPQTSLGSASDAASISSSESIHSTTDNQGSHHQPQHKEQSEKAQAEHVVLQRQTQLSLPSSPASLGGFLLSSSEATQQAGSGNLHLQLQQPALFQQPQQQQQNQPSQQSLAQQMVAQQNLLAAQNVRANYLSGLQEEVLLGSMLHNQQYLANMVQQVRQHQQAQSLPSASIPGIITAHNTNAFVNSSHHPHSMPSSSPSSHQHQHNQQSYDLERIQANAISHHLRNVAAALGNTTNNSEAKKPPPSSSPYYSSSPPKKV